MLGMSTHDGDKLIIAICDKLDILTKKENPID